MTEKAILIIISFIIILLFSANFWDEWANYNYEYLKDKKYVWFWFKVFNIKESKENFKKFIRSMSVMVILIMVISIIFTLLSKD